MSFWEQLLLMGREGASIYFGQFNVKLSTRLNCRWTVVGFTSLYSPKFSFKRGNLSRLLFTF